MTEKNEGGAEEKTTLVYTIKENIVVMHDNGSESILSIY